MANTYKHPGVYVEEIASFPPSIAEVETAIPAFIGFTQNDKQEDGTTLVGLPIRISSLLEYEQVFGGPQMEDGMKVTEVLVNGASRYTVGFNDGKGPSKHIMYYAIRQFYANGGGPCYIVSTGAYLAVGTDIADVSEFGPAIDAVKKVDEVTLLIIVEAQYLDAAIYSPLLQQAMTQAAALGDRFVITDVQDSGANVKLQSDIDKIASDFRSKVATGDEEILRYTAAYFPNILSAFPYSYDAANVDVVTLADGTKKLGTLKSLDQSRVALAIATTPVQLPPASSVAGIYARVDNTRGVWKSPANETVTAASGITCDINDEIQDGLNVDPDAGKSINAIRFFTGKGIKVWGARTLDGNSNEWRYVSVRRYFNMVEESTSKATSAFVFEPNDANTWTKVRAMIENFLTVQWRNGALAGAKPEQAFYVKVGLNQTMTALDILEGRMIVEIGMAVVRPAEFIILQFTHKMQES